jgi:two-component system, cell cycle response regulator
MRVLVVEDDTLSRLITEAAVMKLGHAVLTAANGEEAWQMFQANQFDVVISDRCMPILSGDDLCRRIRRHPSSVYPYFIFLTAQRDKSLILEGMDAGADDYLLKPFDIDELAVRLVVAGRISALHQKLAGQAAEAESLNRQLFEQARTDALTGLGTRRKLLEDLDQISARVNRDGESYCAIMCDVDFFKQYNDRYGHLAGDDVLRIIAESLGGACCDGDEVYRYGGEEFLILIRADAPESALLSAERYRAAIQALQIPHEQSGVGIVTVSLGVAQIGQGRMDMTTAALLDADAALYEAKRSGRNRVSVSFSSFAEEGELDAMLSRKSSRV